MLHALVLAREPRAGQDDGGHEGDMPNPHAKGQNPNPRVPEFITNLCFLLDRITGSEPQLAQGRGSRWSYADLQQPGVWPNILRYMEESSSKVTARECVTCVSDSRIWPFILTCFCYKRKATSLPSVLPKGLPWTPMPL
ncbi:unnamed protein product [Eretmochelys imbricata]